MQLYRSTWLVDVYVGLTALMAQSLLLLNCFSCDVLPVLVVAEMKQEFNAMLYINRAIIGWRYKT